MDFGDGIYYAQLEFMEQTRTIICAASLSYYLVGCQAMTLHTATFTWAR